MELPGDRISRRRREIPEYRKGGAALAAMVGVSRQQLSKWENGKAVPTGENLVALARALGVTPEWILDGDEGGSRGGRVGAPIYAVQAEVNRVREPDHPYEPGEGSPAERLLDLLGMHDATRRAAGLLHRGQTLVTIAYTIALDDGWPIEEIRKIDALRDEILEEERARGS